MWVAPLMNTVPFNPGTGDQQQDGGTRRTWKHTQLTGWSVSVDSCYSVKAETLLLQPLEQRPWWGF